MSSNTFSGLVKAASNAEIMSARAGVETALSGLNRVLSDESKRNKVIEGLLKAIGPEVHWQESVMSDLLSLGKAYNHLAELRQKEVSHPGFNPSLLHLAQTPSLYAHLREQNIGFINSALRRPEIASSYNQLNQAESDLDDQQVEAISVEALISSLTPLELKPEPAVN